MRSRLFTPEDQRVFAALSGDRNPLHLDPLAARRLLVGGAAVHGIHLLLWVLDRLCADGVDVPSLTRLRVHFDRAVRVGEAVTMDWQSAADGRILVRLMGETGSLVRLNLTPGGTACLDWYGETCVPELVCEEHDIESIAGRAGEINLTLAPDWINLFPHLRGFPSAQIAVLLATTRLVGMVCPGLHSIYSALEVNFGTGPISGGLRYQVIRADKRVRLVDMEVSAPGVKGSISALLRPKPYAQPRMTTLMGKVASTAFAGQRAVVIGGSRGLGELAAKLLAAGGAQVDITYLDGAAEATAIVAEATALGLTMNTFRFDASAPPTDVPVSGAPFTHLYFFATPHISTGHPGRFASVSFGRLLSVHVAGLARTVEWFVARAVPAGCVWYPSTFLVDRPDPHFSEYIAAKACGEALCAQLAQHIAPVRVVVERLPRLPTDQTQALTELALGDGVTTLRDALLRVAGLS